MEMQNRKIEVIDDDKEDLIQGFVSIITSFCQNLWSKEEIKEKPKN